MFELVDRLEADGIALRHVDLGGGLGIRYHDEETIDPYAFALAVKRARGSRGHELLFEPGRFLVGNAGADTLTGGSHGAAGDTVAYVFEAGTAAVTVNLSSTAYAGVAASHATDTFGATDTPFASDDALGNVTITGLPHDLTDMSGGTYTAATGSWTGTAAHPPTRRADPRSAN